MREFGSVQPQNPRALLAFAMQPQRDAVEFPALDEA